MENFLQPRPMRLLKANVHALWSSSRGYALFGWWVVPVRRWNCPMRLLETNERVSLIELEGICPFDCWEDCLETKMRAPLIDLEGLCTIGEGIAPVRLLETKRHLPSRIGNHRKWKDSTSNVTIFPNPIAATSSCFRWVLKKKRGKKGLMGQPNHDK